MNNIAFYYQEFEQQLSEIEQYINSIELQKSMVREIEKNEDAIRKITNSAVLYCESIKKVSSTPIQYNAVIISIYGCFEQYIDNIFECYCSNLCEVTTMLKELPTTLRDKQIKKLGDFLTNPQRYKNYELTPEDAIRNAYISYENPKDGLQKNKNLLLTHGGNLGINQISDLARDFGVNNLIPRIVSHFIFKNYFVEKGIHSEETYGRTISGDPKSLFEELDSLVSERNNVAHGWVETRYNFAIIKEKWLNYLRCLAHVLQEILWCSFAEFVYKSKKLYCLGKPIKVYDKHIVCINNGEAVLHKGDYVVAVKDEMVKVILIETIQIEGELVECTDSINKNVGLGLTKRLDLNVDDNYFIYLFK